MARRSRDWNIGLAEDLRNREFARDFLLGAIEEGVPLQVALAKVVRAMGGKECAASVRMASPNVPNGSVESLSGGASPPGPRQLAPAPFMRSLSGCS